MNDVTPIHQWTFDGSKVLMLKCVGKDGITHGGFSWPLTVGARVVAPDWDPADRCGGGLHGWPWGLSPGSGKTPEWDTPWLVFGCDPNDVVAISVDGGGKAKARQGIIRFVGDWHSAMLFVLSGQMAWVAHAASGAASSTGNSGAASSTGYKGAASSTGNRGAASSTGYSGAATVTGTDGKAMAGPYGCIALAFWKTSANRQEMRCAEIGCGDGSDGKLKAGVWYGLDAEGRFQEIL